jgi:hypothetical protein
MRTRSPDNGSTPVTQGAAAPTTPAAPGFHALLEGLEQRAAALHRTEDEPLDVASLGRAVARAREALDITASLIEAFRQELHQSRLDTTP